MSERIPILETLDNGAWVCLEPFEGVRSFAVNLRFYGGVAQEPPDRLGLANVMQTALMKGTKSRDAAGVFDAFDALGAERSVAVEAEALTFRANVLPEHAEQVLLLYRELFETASFPEEEVELAKRLALEHIAALEDRPRSKAFQTALKSALGDPLGRPAPGSLQSVPLISREDAIRFRDDLVRPSGLVITAAGGIDPSSFFQAVDKAFGDWENTGNPPGEVPVTLNPLTVHEPKESEQTHIVVVYPGPSRGVGDFYASMVAQAVLSGSGSSRLFTEVREKRGLAYTVAAVYRPYRGGAVTLLYAGSRAERAEETLAVCLAEADRVAHDVTGEEVDRVKSMLTGRLRTVGELTAGRASALLDDLFLEGRPRSLQEIEARVASVTLEEVRRAAAHYPPQPRAVTVLGPRELR